MEKATFSHDIASQVLYPLITASMETALNHVLYQENVLKPARNRLAGKVLALSINEFPQSIYLIFSEQQVDVLTQWNDETDCTIKTKLLTLIKLTDRQKLSELINRGDITIEGDMQVVQNWSALLDMAPWEPAQYLAPYIGDLAAEGLSLAANKGLKLFTTLFGRQKAYLRDALIEEWKTAPSTLETVHFYDEIEQLAQQTAELEKRLSTLEKK
ncbi:SCP2 domain-containing protein [Proteus mirabilis]|uniref:ubiquinone biosynthesis accessory factor UbiJ n=1 Tax=Proteus mirabilis TaxID=584 RepID=UPI00254F21DC|nr:SCP2 domain-containing protein [Proteus mirabilis]MDK6201456.1 SCP2 domain-containing protein [Proteus mirabilis]